MIERYKSHEKEAPSFKQKIVRMLGALALTFSIGGGLGVLHHIATEETFTKNTYEYTVKPNDTLIGISEKIEGSDKLPTEQDAVHKIEEINNIDNASDLKAGQTIEIPYGVSVGTFNHTAQDIDKAIQNDTAHQSTEES